MNTYAVVNRHGDALMYSTALGDADEFARVMSEGVSRPYTVTRADTTVVSVWFNGRRLEDTEGEA